MERTLERMKKRHEREIKELQRRCKHKGTVKWMPSMWAPGHFGPNVKVCTKCGKELEREKHNLIPEIIELEAE